MIQDLTQSLKSFLEGRTGLQTTQVSLERPDVGFNPGADTVNLFLYDVRECNELRSNEPAVERTGDGRYVVRRPPVRLTCSYLVTAWAEKGEADDVGVLAQQRLLGDALVAVLANPSLPASDLKGSLTHTTHPVSLVAAQADLVRDPAEFWGAIGGRLRPSITLTATIAVALPVGAESGLLVSSAEIRTRSPLDAPDSESSFVVGGTVRHRATQSALAGVVVALPDLGITVTADRDGTFIFPRLARGAYELSASREGFSPVTQTIQVPGTEPDCFDLLLSPSP